LKNRLKKINYTSDCLFCLVNGPPIIIKIYKQNINNTYDLLKRFYFIQLHNKLKSKLF